MGKTRAQAPKIGVTLDTGALVALERGNARMIALLQELAAGGGRVRVPAGVVAQAWRGGSRSAVLARFFRAPQVDVPALDESLARACGELCAAAGLADVIDASVVVIARRHGDAIVTSDVDDLRRLDSLAAIERI